MRKNVLITGGAKGIGAACAMEFARNGYDVIITYLTSEHKAFNLKKKIEKLFGVNVYLFKVDITKEKDIINMINNITKDFKSIDVLINNAAYAMDNNYLDKTKEEFMRVLEVNVVGTFLVTKHLVKYMNNGTVINISSTDATSTYNELSMDYCASKAGVNSLTQTFSMAIPNNRFISIMLPWVNTEAIKDMFPEYLESELKRTNQKRLLEPDEVAKEIYILLNCSDIESGEVKILNVN